MAKSDVPVDWVARIQTLIDADRALCFRWTALYDGAAVFGIWRGRAPEVVAALEISGEAFTLTCSRDGVIFAEVEIPESSPWEVEFRLLRELFRAALEKAASEDAVFWSAVAAAGEPQPA